MKFPTEFLVLAYNSEAICSFVRLGKVYRVLGRRIALMVSLKTKFRSNILKHFSIKCALSPPSNYINCDRIVFSSIARLESSLVLCKKSVNNLESTKA